ncbi:unnamed protein product, partial [Prorocentrum cordatum]
ATECFEAALCHKTNSRAETSLELVQMEPIESKSEGGLEEQAGLVDAYLKVVRDATEAMPMQDEFRRLSQRISAEKARLSSVANEASHIISLRSAAADWKQIDSEIGSMEAASALRLAPESRAPSAAKDAFANVSKTMGGPEALDSEADKANIAKVLTALEKLVAKEDQAAVDNASKTWQMARECDDSAKIITGKIGKQNKVSQGEVSTAIATCSRHLLEFRKLAAVSGWARCSWKGSCIEKRAESLAKLITQVKTDISGNAAISKFMEWLKDAPPAAQVRGSQRENPIALKSDTWDGMIQQL